MLGLEEGKCWKYFMWIINFNQKNRSYTDENDNLHMKFGIHVASKKRQLDQWARLTVIGKIVLLL